MKKGLHGNKEQSRGIGFLTTNLNRNINPNLKTVRETLLIL
jgi:hypothetical protein